VVRSRRKGEQYTPLPKGLRNRQCAIRGHNNPRSSPTEEAAQITKALRTRDKYKIPEFMCGATLFMNNNPNRFIARDQWVAHSWKIGHTARPE
jgi:hypothetical protein